jgi:predicted site-specific integrase-resolvase
MNAKEVKKILGITQPTLSKYAREGRIKFTKINDYFYFYDSDSVYALIGNKKNVSERMIVSYARVSTVSQKDQLVSQSQRIYDSTISRGLKLDKQYEDIKSGMDFNRNGFKELLKNVVQNKIELIVIENKDRLMRFNFETLEYIFSLYGTKILVLNDIIENKTYEKELTQDLISIIHYFTMKSYSHRRKLNKLRKEIENDNTKTKN